MLSALSRLISLQNRDCNLKSRHCITILSGPFLFNIQTEPYLVLAWLIPKPFRSIKESFEKLELNISATASIQDPRKPRFEKLELE